MPPSSIASLRASRADYLITLAILVLGSGGQKTHSNRLPISTTNPPSHYLLCWPIRWAPKCFFVCFIQFLPRARSHRLSGGTRPRNPSLPGAWLLRGGLLPYIGMWPSPATLFPGARPSPSSGGECSGVPIPRMVPPLPWHRRDGHPGQVSWSSRI